MAHLLDLEWDDAWSGCEFAQKEITAAAREAKRKTNPGGTSTSKRGELGSTWSRKQMAKKRAEADRLRRRSATRTLAAERSEGRAPDSAPSTDE